MKKENEKGVRLQAYFEIYLLIAGMFAFSYLIRGVSAEASVIPEFNVCCEKTIDGAWCQNTLEQNCDENLRKTPTSCEATSFCKRGCCYDSTEGVCMPNTPEKVCETEGGIWNEDSECNIPQCQLGCCVIGQQASFVTLTRCKRLSTLYGLGIDFRTDVSDELSCIELAQEQDVGACVFENEFFERACRFTTRGDCINTFTGEFHEDHLCTDEELGTICAKTKNTACMEGKEEVYFLDSCGNPGNIYDASKADDDLYWKEIISKEDSCTANSNDKDCGNCEYFKGNICSESSGLAKPIYGDYICKDLNCEDENGKQWKHGESWCEYDGNIGQGSDAVGSRHFRKICDNGEIRIESCKDMRGEYCLQNTVEASGGEFTEAACILNRWQTCIDTDNEKDCLDTQERDCYWIQGNKWKLTPKSTQAQAQTTSTLGSTFSGGTTGGFEQPAPENKNGVCLPEIPPGTRFWNQQETTSYCGLASKTCVYTKTKKVTGSSEENAECLTSEWVDERNLVCTSLGDCGAYVNYLNDYTYEGVERKEQGKKAIDLDPKKLFGSVLLDSAVERAGINIKRPAPIVNPLDKLFKGIGLATGVGLVSGVGPGIGGLAGKKVMGLFKFLFQSGTGDNAVTLPIAKTLMSNLIFAGIMAGIGYVIGKNIGMGGNAGAAMATAFGVGTFASSIIHESLVIHGVFEGVAAGQASFTSVFWGFALPAIAIGAIIFIAMYKDEQKKIIQFTCKPWEAPWGGEDCKKCNEGDLDCSEYRCRSLGKACELINIGSEDEKCVWKNPRDVTTPGIRPLEDKERKIPTPRHDYIEVRIRPPGDGSEPGRMKIISTETSDGCLKAFTPIEFGIQTFNEKDELEPTQCKIDFVHTSSFTNMSYDMGGSSLLTEEHIEKLALPGGQTNEMIEPLQLQNNGIMSFYIRCADANGNMNVDEFEVSFCVQKGPDTTPPKIEGYNIPSRNPVQYDTKELDLEVYVNEPSECKWSRIDSDYNNMESDEAHQMKCYNNAWEMNANLVYTCETKLTGIENRKDNIYYIRCKDQPDAEEADRNPNIQSSEYTIIGTQPLNILSAEPNDKTISGSTNVIPVFLNVKTDNGFNNGESICFFSTTEEEKDYLAFAENEGTEHSQRQDLAPGDYTYYLKCVDLGGNADYTSISFTLESDSTAPIVARAYKERDNLKIITNEKSECSYSNIDCNFNIGDGILMPGEESHTANWEDNTYYIRCKDEYDNQPYPNSCSIIIKPWELIEE